jgi:putative ABC transport system permease protein
LKLHVNDKKTNWVVVGFFQFAGKNGGLTAYASYDYLSMLTGPNNQAVLYRIVGSHPPLSVNQQDRLALGIQAQLKKSNIKVVGLETGAYLTNVAGGGFAALTAFLLFLAVLTALVGSIGLAGTMSMNVLERTREIGIMRAIGASDRTLMAMVLVEGMVIGFISYLLGALLAFPISKVMSDGISYSVFNAPSNFGFTPIGFVIWFGVVFVLSFLASVMPARNAVRLTIREVLAYE